MNWVGWIVIIVVLYFISSGAAFVAMYRWPATFPNRLASRFYAPLEWIAKRARPFGEAYTRFQWRCYRHIVNDYRKSGAPTPPPPPFISAHRK